MQLQKQKKQCSKGNNNGNNDKHDFIFNYKQLVKELEQLKSKKVTASVTSNIQEIRVQNNKRSDFSEAIARTENLEKKANKIKKQIKYVLNIIYNWLGTLYLEARVIARYYVINDIPFTDISKILNMPLKEVEEIFENSLTYLVLDNKKRNVDSLYYINEDYTGILYRENNKYKNRYKDLTTIDNLIIDTADIEKYQYNLDCFNQKLDRYNYLCFVECYQRFKITTYAIARMFNVSIQEVEENIIKLKLEFLELIKQNIKPTTRENNVENTIENNVENTVEYNVENIIANIISG